MPAPSCVYPFHNRSAESARPAIAPGALLIVTAPRLRGGLFLFAPLNGKARVDHCARCLETRLGGGMLG